MYDYNTNINIIVPPLVSCPKNIKTLLSNYILSTITFYQQLLSCKIPIQCVACTDTPLQSPSEWKSSAVADCRTKISCHW